MHHRHTTAAHPHHRLMRHLGTVWQRIKTNDGPLFIAIALLGAAAISAAAGQSLAAWTAAGGIVAIWAAGAVSRGHRQRRR